MRVNVVTVASSLRDRSVMEARETEYRDRLAAVGKSAGVELAWLRPEATAAELGAGAGLIVLVLSGGTERAGLSLMARWGGPCVLLAHSSDNALAAALEMLSVAGTDGARCRIVQARPGWNEEIGRALRVMRAHHMMATSVLGAVGAATSSPCEMRAGPAVSPNLGRDVRRIAMAELMDAYRGEEDEPARRIADELAAAAGVRRAHWREHDGLGQTVLCAEGHHHQIWSHGCDGAVLRAAGAFAGHGVLRAGPPQRRGGAGGL